ncbi:MAG: hypothetical protein FWB75_07605 [Oscillospiraceae bacterium]|nr:hypothetical protein [Oscillospiraceae bacterium]
MRQRSKSTLFLIEQLIVIAVFAICATACISILTNAYFQARDSRDISNALLAAESVAESFKAVSGDFDTAAEISGGQAELLDGGYRAITVFFDSNWQVSSETAAEYILRLTGNHSAPPPAVPTPTPLLTTTTLTVNRISGDELVSFPVAVRLPIGGA